MKIGLIGINKYAKYLNFACDLHIYAFQQFLNQHGHESVILDYKPVYFGGFNMRYPAGYAERRHREALRNGASSSDVAKRAELAKGYRSVVRERRRRYEKFQRFISKNLVFTHEVYDSDLLEVRDPGLDCYICVTDVIWQPVAPYGFDRGFLLGSRSFEGKKKISYAASRGASKDFPSDQEDLFFSYLEDMDAISVREQDFSEYIESKSGLTATTVLDPVMFHDAPFWEKVAQKPKEERYVVLYYVMEKSTDTIAKAVEYAKLHDLTIVELSDRPLKNGKITDPDVKHVARYDVGMEEWLGYIQHAESVFTNSFHGCCFSLLFEKKFFVGSRNGQKVPNFLAKFGLGGRRFDGRTDVSELPGDIDYAPVREILAAERQLSSEFILGAIDDAQRSIDEGAEFDAEQYEARRRRLTFPVRFHSDWPGVTRRSRPALPSSRPQGLEFERLGSGALEYWYRDTRYVNDGLILAEAPVFESQARKFLGWTVRFRVDNRWFWCMSDGSVQPGTVGGEELNARKAVIAPGEHIPHFPVNHVSAAVLVAKWGGGGLVTHLAIFARAVVARARHFARRMVANTRWG